MTTRMVLSLVTNALRKVPVRTSLSSETPPALMPMKASTAPRISSTQPMMQGKKPAPSVKLFMNFSCVEVMMT